MQAEEVLSLGRALDERGVVCWLDGGWGVDCLLREQTREHSDLDLVVGRRHLDRVTGYLEHNAFKVIRNWLPTSIAFRHVAGREVDLHPVDVASDGGGDQVLPDGSRWHHSAPVEGRIDSRAVRCAPPHDQLSMHQGYDPRPVDYADVRRIAERFHLPAPPPFDTAIDDWR